MIKSHQLLLIFFLLIMQSCTGKTNMQNTEIHYKIAIQNDGYRYDIMINGVSIQDDVDGHPVTVEIPVNQFVRTGKNVIDVSLYPWDDNEPLHTRADAKISVALKMYREDAEDLGGIVISKVEYIQQNSVKGTGFEGSTKSGRYVFTDKLVKDKKGDYIISDIAIKELSEIEGAINATQEIQMETPFPEWAFFNSDKIPQSADMTDEEFNVTLMPSLFKQYEKIHTALKKQDLDSILPLFSERNRELDLAFYYESGTYEEMLKEEIKGEFENNMLLDEIALKKAAETVSLYGNLVKMGSRPLIYFYNKEKSVFNSYDIWFRRDGDKWIISR